MSLTIQLPLTIEQNLRKNATKQGVSLENYVMHILSINSKEKGIKKNKKDLTENDLLMHVQLDVLPHDLEEFYRLSNLFKSGNITETEYQKLTQLNDLIEIAHAERMKHLLNLAKFRHVSLEKIMDDLGIERHAA